MARISPLAKKQKSQVPVHLAPSQLNQSLVVTPFSVEYFFLPSCAEAVRSLPKPRQGASMLHLRLEQPSDMFQHTILRLTHKNRLQTFGTCI